MSSTSNKTNLDYVIIILLVITLITSGIITYNISPLKNNISELQSDISEIKEAINAITPTITPETPDVVFTWQYGVVTSLDPLQGRAGTATQYSATLYDPLIRVKPGTTDVFEPALATAWEISPDGLTWTFNLREGVKFHDGTDFKADSVKWTYDRIMAKGEQPKSFLKVVNEVEIVDDYTVKMKLERRYYPFIAIMASEVMFPIVSISTKEHEVNGDYATEWMKDHGIGTGPYKLKEFVPGELLIFEKFDDYWRGWENTNNNIDKIVVKNIREFYRQKVSLILHEVQRTPIIAEDWDTYESITGLTPKSSTVAASGYCLMRMRPGTPLSDIKLRQAVQYAFDSAALIEAAWSGRANPPQSCIPSTMVGFEQQDMIETDFDIARQLRAEAGYEEGELTLKYIYNLESWKKSMGEILQANLAEIGINLELHGVTWPTLQDSMADPDADYDLYAFYADSVIADILRPIRLIWHSESIGPEGYNKYVPDPELDQLIEDAESSTSEEQYLTNMAKVQKYVVENQLALFAVEMSRLHAEWDYVKGYEFDPLTVTKMNVYDMWIDLELRDELS